MHFLFGEYVLSAEEKDFPRLLTLISEEKLSFWGEKCGEDGCTLRASVFSCESIMRLAERNGIELKISARHGIPFVFSRYKRRPGLYIGLILGLALLFVSQLFVWRITVSGNIGVSTEEILECLDDCGIRVGSYIPSIDPDRDANAILISFDKLSSMAINLNGTQISVVVLERTKVPDIVDESGYYNVVAAYDGIILEVGAAEGAPEVRAGDVVAEGQLLINSFIEGRNGTFRPTHARGYVYARVKQSFHLSVPLTQIRKKYTGATEIKTTLFVLGRDIDLFIDAESPYEYCDATVTEKEKKLFGFIGLPVTETEVTFYEYVPVETHISQHEAEEIARNGFEDFIKSFSGELLETESEFTYDEANGICVLDANAVLKLDIAKEIPLFISPSP